MREILFRGKNKIYGQWVYGTYEYSISRDGSKTHFIKNYGVCVNRVYEIDPATLCQYIGVTDCKHNMIYEGDIDISDPTAPMVVVYHNAEFGLKYSVKISDTYLNTCIDWELTHMQYNVHDNPEILTEGLYGTHILNN